MDTPKLIIEWDGENPISAMGSANLGAAYYVSKYVTKQFGDWDLSDNIRAFHEYQQALNDPRARIVR